MDNSAALWFSEVGMEDPFVMNEEFDIMEYLDEVELSFVLEENSLNYESNSINCSKLPSTISSPTTMIPRTDSTTTICTSASIKAPPVLPPECAERRTTKQRRKSSTKSPIILTFGNPTVQEHRLSNGNEEVLIRSSDSLANINDEAKKVEKKSSGRKRPQSQTYDHILAERKRREMLSQQFVALSAIVPGLKKTDKTSVLGDAINYLKHLQERVKTFEERSTEQTMESLVILKKSQVFIEDEGSSDEMGGGGGGSGGSSSSDEQTLPEIEAKVCEKSVLLKVLCHRNKGVLVNLLSEIEKMNLCVTNTNVAQFGSLALDITIIAEMEEEFNLTIKELIIRLQYALQRSNQEE